MIFGSRETARRNIQESEEARKVLTRIEKRTSPWMNISKTDLRKKVPPPEVPRAFNSSFLGCPEHGMDLYKYGNYAWIIEPFKRPWKLKCPIGGEEYPSNDFQAFLDSKLSDRSLLDGPYPDDGWGWKGQNGVNYWFIAYFCHWFWYNHLIPAVLDLSRAYVLTADENYASRCLTLLDRIADYYPQMDYKRQCRYAKEFRPDYTGKIVNRIWETKVIRKLAESIDNISGYLETGNFQSTKRGMEEERSHLQENLLIEGLEAIHDGKIKGNYGMHQRSLLVILKSLKRDSVSREEIDWLLNNSGDGYSFQGLRYGLDNFIHREGMSFENAPGYCYTWTTNMIRIAFHLESLGVDFPDYLKLKRMVEAPERITCLGKFTPSIGDSGSVSSGKKEIPPCESSLAKELFSTAMPGTKDENEFSCYEELFQEKSSAPARGESLARVKKTDCLPGYGLALLRAKDMECSMFFGPKNGHGHYDRLGIEIFANGRKLSPDLGYPQFAAESKSPSAWEKNTISHNTVVVNERKQETGTGGRVRLFHAGRDVQLAEAESNGTYEDADLYMRTLCILGKQDPFLVDIFRVRGGHQHDYSIHGFHADFETRGISLEPRKGTLAGREVPYGYLYDDPELEEDKGERSFHSYKGSGYSFLYDIKEGQPHGIWRADWNSRELNLKAFFASETDQVFCARGKPPIKPGNPEFLRYVILRNRGDDIFSKFTTVIESNKPNQGVQSVRRIPMDSDDEGSVGLEVEKSDSTYIILSGVLGPSVMKGEHWKFEGRFAAIKLNQDRELERIFMNGRQLVWKRIEVEMNEEVKGTIMGVDYASEELTVSFPIQDVGNLEGEMALIDSNGRGTAFRVEKSQTHNSAAILKLEGSGRIGRILVERTAADNWETHTDLKLASRGHYDGAVLVDGEGREARIERIRDGKISLSGDTGNLTPGEMEIWEYGPGDTVRFNTRFSAELDQDRLKGTSNVGFKMYVGDSTRTVGPGRFEDIFDNPLKVLYE